MEFSKRVTSGRCGRRHLRPDGGSGRSVSGSGDVAGGETGSRGSSSHREGMGVECEEQVRSFRAPAARGCIERGRGISAGSFVEDGGWQAGREGAIGGERLPGPRFKGGLVGDLWMRLASVISSSSGLAECSQEMEVAEPGNSECFFVGR